MTKASSFHGVTVLSRADSCVTSTGGYYLPKTGDHLFFSYLHIKYSLQKLASVTFVEIVPSWWCGVTVPSVLSTLNSPIVSYRTCDFIVTYC